MKKILGKIKSVAVMLLLFCVVTNSMPAYASDISLGNLSVTESNAEEEYIDFCEDNTDVDNSFEIDMTDDSFSASELELNVNLGEIESGIELPERINKSNDSTGNEGESGTNSAVSEPIGPTHYYVTDTTPATCSSKGKEVKRCSTNKPCATHPVKTTILAIDPNNHVKKVTEITYPICVNDGYKIVRCADCKNELSKTVVRRTNHHMETSYDAAGNRTDSCTNRGCTYTVYTPAPTPSDPNPKPTIPSTIEVTKVSFKRSSADIPVGYELKIESTVEPANATNKNLVWSSSDTSIATVYSPGIVKGIKKGTVTITARSNNGKTATCKVNVHPYVEYTKPEEIKATNVPTETVADPINAYTGAHEIDIELISLGGASNISVGLKYKSNKTIEGIFGKGFYWNYESFIEEKNDEINVYHSPTEFVNYSKDSSKETNAYTTSTLGNETDILTKNSDGTYTLISHGKTFTFNKEGKLSSVVSKTGKTVELTYGMSEINLVDKISGQTITLSLNEKGLVNEVKGGSSKATIEYNKEGFITRVVDVDGYETLYTYDALGQVLTATDAEGNTYFTDEYDEYGRVIAQTDASNNKSYFEYLNNIDGIRTVTQTDREGNKKTYTFDSYGRKIKEVDEEEHETSYTYDSKGNLVKVVDALQNKTEKAYDLRGNLTKETNALGYITSYTYDSRDNLTKITYPDGSVDKFAYNSKNELTSTIDRRGLRTVYSYDTNGYLVKTKTSKASDQTVKKKIYHVHKGSEAETPNGCYKTECKEEDKVVQCPGTMVFAGFGYPDGTGSKIFECSNPLGSTKHARCYDGSYGVITGGQAYAPLNSYPCFSKWTEEGKTVYKCLEKTDEVIGEISYKGGKNPSITYSESKIKVKGFSWTTSNGKIESGATSSSCVTSTPGTYTCKVTYEDLCSNEKRTVSVSVITYDADYNNAPFLSKEITYTYEKGNVKTIKDSYGNTTTFKYDTNDHLVETITPDGAKTTNKVSNYGSVLSVIDPLLNETKTTYTSMAKPKTTTDPEGNVVNNAYDERQLLVSVTDAKGAKTAYSYDKEERLKKVTYVDGSFMENFYDKAGRLVKTVDALGYETSYTVDALGRTKEVVNPLNGKTSYTYTPLGKIETETDKNGNKTSYTYNSVGAVETITNPYGGVSKYTYNKAGDLVLLEDALGNKTTYSYDIYGQKISETDPNGNTTTYSYDKNGNVVKSTNALNESTYYTYDSKNQLKTIEKDHLGQRTVITKYDYDLNGRVIASYDALGNKTSTIYDKRGNVSKVIDALNHETLYKYDKNNQLVETTNARGKKTTYTVNNLNQVEKVTDALGLVTAFSYDKNGRRVKSTNPLGGVSENIYDKVGNITTLTGPGGAATTLSYDLNGNLTERSTIEGNVVTYTYNALNLVEEYQNARGNKSTYEYDLLGRIVKANTPEGTISYTYDKNGNVLTVTDKNGTVTRTYDALNRVKTITDQKGNKVGYTYDDKGNLKELIYPDNTKVIYTYDLNHNLLTVKDFLNKTTSYTYDSLNREIETLHPDGRKTKKAYDEVGNLVSLIELSKAGTKLDETLYTYDDINRLIVEKYTVRGYSYEYTYDDLSRVTSRVTKNTSTKAVIATETFNLDAAGNITSSVTEKGNKALTYEALDNHLKTVNGSSYTFDKDGNLISGLLNGKTTKLTYDSRNHLLSVGSDTYTYDSEDYRLSSKVTVITSTSTTSSTSEVSELESIESETDELEDKDEALTNESTENQIELNASTEATESLDTEESLITLEAVDSFDTSGDIESPETIDALVSVNLLNVSESIGNIELSEVPLATDSQETENTIINDESSEDNDDPEIVEEDNGATSEETHAVSDDISGNDINEAIEESNLKDKDLTELDESVFSDLEVIGEMSDIDLSLINATASTTKVVEASYCYDRENKNLLVTYTADGEITKYVYGNGLISSYKTKGSTTEYRNYTYDLRGSVTKTYDASGKVISEYTYSTYGDRKTIKGDKNECIGYCGREGVLTETNGLIYMRARYYSVELMRFINEDIVLGDIGNSSSLNRYTYVEGNPATMIDPFGLCAEVSVESVLEAVHTTLDILGMFPGLGIGPDAINTILYIIEGDWKNAALSGIALLPAIGEIASGGKMTAKLYKALSCLKKADKIEDTISLTAKYGDTAAKVLAEYSDEMVEGVAKQFDEVAEAISKGGSNSNIITDPSRLLGTTVNPQDHHIIPAFRGKSKSYADFIKNLGIDVDQYTITVSGGKGGMHMNFIHGKGKWNQKWMNFIDSHPNATAKDVYQFAGKMMDDYGLSGLKIHPYGK